MKPPGLIALCLTITMSSAISAEKRFTVTVAAGDFDRRDAVAMFALPEGAKGEELSLLREGKTFPIQTTKDGRASFVAGDIKRGESILYELTAGRPTYGATSSGLVTAQRKGNLIEFNHSAGAPTGNQPSRPLVAYQAEPGKFPRDDIKPVFRRGGYLHPIYTPSGKLVTDDFPPNHIHHHGVWGAWTHTEFDGRKPDFWNMGDGKGRVEFVSLEDSWSGPVNGGFRSRHRFVDLTAPQPVTALNETWEVKVYSPANDAANYWFFDLVSEQQCATVSALKLPEYRYGGVGVRGNRAWNGKDNALFLTSEGETDRDKGNTTRGRWCDMGGLVDGSRVGIAILCHPENFRAPQPMRLHPDEPFFNFAPQQAGDMEIKPGEKYVARYRFVIHDGPPDKAELDRLWNDYAHPPTVTVR